MPYYKQGIETAENSMKLEMKLLNKQGFFKSNSDLKAVIKWGAGETNSKEIGLYVCNTENPKHISLIYSYSQKETNLSFNFNYRINLIEKKSNLGRGVYYYFECPETLKPCRILYLAYGNGEFKSRYAYTKKIYYRLQKLSKQAYPINRIWDLENKIKALRDSGIRESYKGNKTKSMQRLKSLQEKQYKFEVKNAKQVFKNLSKLYERIKHEKIPI